MSSADHAEIPSIATPRADASGVPPKDGAQEPIASARSFVSAGTDSFSADAATACAFAYTFAGREPSASAAPSASATCVHSPALSGTLAKSDHACVKLALYETMSAGSSEDPPRRKVTAEPCPYPNSVATSPLDRSAANTPRGEGLAQSPNVKPPAALTSSSSPDSRAPESVGSWR